MKRIYVLLIFMLLSKSVGAYDLVFYCTYQNNECIESKNSISLDRKGVARVVKNVIANEKNFIGFVDRIGTTIQFYVDELDKIWIEIPSPHDKGSFGKHISNEEMMLLVEQLKEPYLPYKEDLKLKFRKW